MKNRIKKFTEAIEIDKFKEVTDDILSLIEKTVEKEQGEDKIKNFISLYIKNPTDTKIEGLIEDSQIYNFYKKYRNQIDECLKQVKFFDQPADVSRLYDYVIKGTNFAIIEFVKSLYEKL